MDTEETTALVPVKSEAIDFYGDRIPAALVEVSGHTRIFVALRPICDRLGLDWSSQLKRLRRSSVLSDSVRSVVMSATEQPPSVVMSATERTSTVAMTATDGGVLRTLICLPAERLDAWLFGVDEHRVDPTIRDRLLRYQRECADALAHHFGRMARPSPAAQLSAPNLDQLAYQVAEMQSQIALARRQLAHRPTDRPLHTRANGGCRDAARELTRIYAEIAAARRWIEDWKRRQTEPIADSR